MTREPRRPADPDALTDDGIAELVRDAAASWTMPPVRLDAPSWRERVRGPRARRVATARGWFGRVGRAASAAVALTLVGALVAVVLTRPAQGPGKIPEASPNASPGATSPLPRLLVNGDAPAPLELVVQTEQGDFARVDLAKGVIGGALTGARYGSDLRAAADGTMVCLCLSESLDVDGSPTRAEVTLKRYDAAGMLVATTPIESFSGEPDPRDVGRFIPDQPGHVFTAMSFSADGRYGFVGWSARAHPAWKSGIVVVDLLDGGIAGRLELPNGSTGDENSRRVVAAPRIVGSTESNGRLVARSWYEFSPPASESAYYTFGSDVFQVRFRGGGWSDLAPVPAAPGCGDAVLRGGALAGGGRWLACSREGSSQTVIRRLAPDGTLLGDTDVLGPAGIDGDATALSLDGTSLFAWNPATATLTAVDLSTGTTRTSHGQTARIGAGPLGGFGDWLAPAASAKSLLRGAVVVAPDGSRVYAIGVAGGGGGHESSGSSGIFVFDAATLASAGHWDPIADFVSLAVSRDGRFLYAAGMPGVDAAGSSRPDQAASITVFATVDGGTRLIAGQLGSGIITFRSPALD